MRTHRAAVLTFDKKSKLQYLPYAELRADAQGRIASLRPLPLPRGRRCERLLIPGLIDAHCHLSQYPAVARDGLPLLPWLKKHIFPLEADFRAKKARPRARAFFQELAANGTTFAAIYTSIWQDSTQVCFEEAERSGLRAIMGKVMMDRRSYGGAHGSLRGENLTELSIRQSCELCERWHGQGKGRLFYAFTPRFALSCSPELLREAGRLARRYGAFVQTHLSENRDEVAAVRREFPSARSYAEVYERAGLLGPRTILAHCIWLSQAERRLIARSGAAVAHCPTSNAFLGSGIMDLRRLREGGIGLSLGSDVGAGPSLDMFEVMRQAVFGQRLARAHGLMDGPAPDAREAFRLATLDGARSLGFADALGSLETGKQADMVLLDRRAFEPRFCEDDSAQALVSRLVYRAGRSAVRETWVAGRRVY
ncbi:MAG: guanine deaminase [Elusimicrobiota bacterium]|jgi:guanine deaminase